MTRHTYEMSKWVFEMSYENIPKEVVCKAKDQLLNLFGAMFAGYTAGPGNIIAETVRSWGGEPRATVVGSDYKTSVINAALVNSALAQALDYDDWVCRTHAGAAIVPTALAVAEGENLGGKDLLTAQIIGNEIVGRVGETIHRGRAFGNGLPVHPVESALVAGRLMRLNVSQLTDAIGISCFFATQFPLIGWVSPAKALLTSIPIMHGIMGAEFARRGLKGYRRMLEHPLGYLHSVSERVDSTHLTEGLGKEWITEKLVFKPYPSMGFSQVLIDCALEIVNEHCIDPDNVEEVILRGPSLLPLLERWYKGGTNLFELIRRGEWSYTTLTVEFFYPIAAAIVDKELTPKQFVRERIFDPRIQELYKRIRCEVDPQLDKMYAKRDFRLGVGGGEVEIRLKDGKAYKKRADRMRGHPENLEDTFRVEDKFKAEASETIGEERVAKVIDLVRELEKVTDLKRLTKNLTK